MSRELIESWEFNARDSQLPPPGDWFTWLLLTGRGFGKTRSLSGWVHEQAATHPGSAGFLAARTLGDAQRALIGHPNAGILATQLATNPCELKTHPTRRIVWANGSFADVQTSEEPEGARGPEYGWGVADEIGTWKRTVDFNGNDLWTNLAACTRAGADPRIVAATTPRPTDTIKRLVDRAQRGAGVVLTTGSLYENADNLPASWIAELEERHKGTRLERQEMLGELLTDIEGAIVTSDMLDATRVESPPELARVVVGVDPALKAKKKSDKTGISVTGLGIDGDLYSLANRGGRFTPDDWSRRIVDLCDEFATSTVVAEDNAIGDAIKTLIHAHGDRGRRIRVLSRTAKLNKARRAEPVLAHYERAASNEAVGAGAHIVGVQPELEDQLTQFTAQTWEGEGSPDDADAHVWAATELTQGASSSWGDMAALNA